MKQVIAMVMLAACASGMEEKERAQEVSSGTRLSRAMLRVANTMGPEVCRVYVSRFGSRCAQFLGRRDGADVIPGTADDDPVPTMAELTQRLGSDVAALESYVVEQGLLGDPCHGEAEEAAARAAFDLWRAGQPRDDGYLGIWSYQLNNVLRVVADERPGHAGEPLFVLAIGWETWSPNRTWFQRSIVAIDHEGEEVALGWGLGPSSAGEGGGGSFKLVGRALRVFPDGRMLVDANIDAHEIGPGTTSEYYETGDARVLERRAGGARLGARVVSGGHLSPGGVWRLGGGQQVVLSPYYPHTFDASRGTLYAPGAPPPDCGGLMPVSVGGSYEERRLARGAADERAVVRLANTFEATYFSNWTLSANAAVRDGADGLYNTADDVLFSSVAELRQAYSIELELSTQHVLVNRCAGAAEEQRALLAYRAWRKQQPAVPVGGELAYRLLGPVAADASRLVIAVEREQRYTWHTYDHSFFLVWLDDAGVERKRVSARVLRLSPGGALIGGGYDWRDGSLGTAEPKAANTFGLIDLEGVVWSRSAATRLGRESIWPYADGSAFFSVQWSEDGWINAFKSGKPLAYSLATGQPVPAPEPQCGQDW